MLRFTCGERKIWSNIKKAQNIMTRIVSAGALRQGMPTQGPTSDRKCKLIISSFLTLPHLLDSLICTRNDISIVLLLQMMGGWDRWGVVVLYQGLGGGTGGGYNLIFFAFFFLVLLYFVASCSQSLYLGGQKMMAVVSVSLFFLYFLCLWSL